MTLGTPDTSTTGHLHVRRLDQDAFDAFAQRHRQRRAQRLVEAGRDAREAEEVAGAELAAVFPDGWRTSDQHVVEVTADEAVLGQAWLWVRPTSEGREAVLRDLAVADADRPDVLVAATEAYAAREGADRLHVLVPRAAVPTFEQLGYGVTTFRLFRRIAGTEPLRYDGVPELRLEPMTPAQYDAFRAAVAADHGRTRALAGVLPRLESDTLAGQVFDRLPDGVDTEGQTFLVGYDGDRAVASAWLRLGDGPAGDRAWVNYLVVDEAVRGTDYGKAMSVALSGFIRAAGTSEVRFAIYGPNLPSRRLAQHAGYSVVEVQLRKDLVVTS